MKRSNAKKSLIYRVDVLRNSASNVESAIDPRAIVSVKAS